MTQRLDANTVSPQGRKALLGLQALVDASGLERSLLDLINVRASQINGCAYCLHVHSREAIAHGERPERLYVLAGWRDSGAFSARECAALAWTDAVTLIAEDGVDDGTYEAVRAEFDEQALVALNYAVIAINAWNRLAIPFRKALPIASGA